MQETLSIIECGENGAPLRLEYSQQSLAFPISGRRLKTGLFPVASRSHDMKFIPGQVNRESRRLKQRCGPGLEINVSIGRM